MKITDVVMGIKLTSTLDEELMEKLGVVETSTISEDDPGG